MMSKRMQEVPNVHWELPLCKAIWIRGFNGQRRRIELMAIDDDVAAEFKKSFNLKLESRNEKTR